jgi:endoglucanase
LIGLFEEHEWDWSYHAFREWDGWSLEHDSDINDPNPNTTPTARFKVVKAWLKQNQKTSD